MNVTLENLKIEHFDALYHIKNDKDVLENIPGGYPLDRTSFDNRLLQSIETETTREVGSTILVDGETAGLIGHFCRDDREQIEVGYYIGKSWWGRGIATESLVLHLQKMHNLGISGKVFASHAVDNIASGRVLQKAGFHFHGEIRFTLPDGTTVMDHQWLILL